MTYDYQTRHMTLDFHMVRAGSKCHLRGLPAKVGEHGCKHCPYHKGSASNFRELVHDGLWFVKCSHPQATDSAECSTVRREIFERLEQSALAALD